MIILSLRALHLYMYWSVFNDTCSLRSPTCKVQNIPDNPTKDLGTWYVIDWFCFLPSATEPCEHFIGLQDFE